MDGVKITKVTNFDLYKDSEPKVEMKTLVNDPKNRGILKVEINTYWDSHGDYVPWKCSLLDNKPSKLFTGFNKLEAKISTWTREWSDGDKYEMEKWDIYADGKELFADVESYQFDKQDLTLRVEAVIGWG